MEDQKLADPSQLSKAKLFWTLFSTTFTLSAFTFGGGYVIVPLMREAFVEKLRWVDENEMIDLIAIAQSAPGPIAVNTSIHVGFFLNALKYGPPPHGGIAPGIDRIVMIMAQQSSIKEVIAFPKNSAAISPMDDAPSLVDQKQLDELHLIIKQ
jgi:hypothetical protein